MRVILAFLLILFTLHCKSADAFDKVVIWGHKLHSHTHSYVHHAFYRAFKHMGYETHWFDDEDDIGDFDFSHTLFLTEGQVDQKIPIREDCEYILHNCRSPKYTFLREKGKAINLQVYTDDCLTHAGEPGWIEVAKCIYFDVEGKTVYMPWATDLLPYEIDDVKRSLPRAKKQKKIYWIGTIGKGEIGNMEELAPFMNACRASRISFKHKTHVSMEKNQRLILSSYMAPAIVGTWQKKHGYIPCRIFKNISYGQMGITNSLRVFELFEKKIVYNPDPYQLFFDAKKRIENQRKEEIYELMDLVKTKHTYINRIETLLSFFDLLKENQKTAAASDV